MKITLADNSELLEALEENPVDISLTREDMEDLKLVKDPETRRLALRMRLQDKLRSKVALRTLGVI